MKNLLRTDFYKLVKSKSLYICSLIYLMFIPVGIYTVKFLSDLAVEQEGLEVYTTTPDNLSFAGTIGSAFNMDILMFLAIIVSIFIGSEFTLGTIKNTASKAYSRVKIFLSKWIVSMAVANGLMVLFVVLYGVLATAIWGYGDPGAGFFLEFLTALGLEMLLCSAYVTLFVTMIFLIRQSGAAIAATICFYLFFGNILSLIDLLMNSVFKVDSAISELWFDKVIQEVALLDMSGNLMMKSILLSAVVIGISLFVGIVSFQKRDIK